MRGAIEQHDQGLFIESSLLSTALTKFGPVYAALGQRIAPSISLPRHVVGGTRGMARIIRGELEDQLAPRSGLCPSAYFPPWLWGSLAIERVFQGFSVIQHAYGDEDPKTGVRPVYSRRWPTWAVQWYPYRRTYVAITMEHGPIDIISGDGKFTMVADEEEPHLNAALRALAPEALDGVMAKQARANYIDRYGDPKWWATMPEKIAVKSPEGQDFFDSLRMLRDPGGFAALPFGATLDKAELTGGQSDVFQADIDCVWQFVAAIVLGSDGTMTRGSGVYSAPIFAGVRRDLIDRDITCGVRAVNVGHVLPQLAFNYSETIEREKARGSWVEPALQIQLPDPDSDARIKSISDRIEKRAAIIKTEKDTGFEVTQERVDELSEQLEIPTIVYAGESKGATSFEYDQNNGVLTIDERRAELGKPPMPADGGLTIPEFRAKLAANSAPKPTPSDEPEPPPDGAEPPGGAGASAGPPKPPPMPRPPEPAKGPEGSYSEARSRREPALLDVALQVRDFDESKVKRDKGKFATKEGKPAEPKKPVKKEPPKKPKGPSKKEPGKVTKPAKKAPTYGSGDAARDAVGFSRVAKDSGDKAAKGQGSHSSAADTHDKAAEKHERAAKASRKPEYKQAHADAAKAHRDLAAHHRERAKGELSADEKSARVAKALRSLPEKDHEIDEAAVVDADKANRAHVKSAQKSMSADERERVSDYCGNTFSAVRQKETMTPDERRERLARLMGKKPDSKAVQKEWERDEKDLDDFHSGIDKLAKSAPPPPPALLRGFSLGDSAMHDLLTKDSLDLGGMSSSSSLSWNSARGFATGHLGEADYRGEESKHAVVLHIDKTTGEHSPVGSMGITHEMETVLRRDAKFKIVGRSVGSDGVVSIHVHEIERPAVPIPSKPLAVGAGGHIGKLQSTVPKRQARAIANLVNEHPIVNATLQVHPLSTMTVDGPLAGKDLSNGTYIHRPPPPDSDKLARCEIHLNQQGPANSKKFGNGPLVPGKTSKITATGKTPEERAKMTMTHELGHHLQFASDSFSDAESTYAKAKPITAYAATKGPREYFAECYSAYVHHHDALKAHDPEGHAMIERALRKSKIVR